MRGHYEGKIRVAIIGCGSMSYSHLRSLVSAPEVELVGFADVKMEAALKLKEEFVGKGNSLVFTDYKEMIKKSRPNAVEVFTPHSLHFSQCLNALEKGCHVLVEKPMTTEVLHAQKLIGMAKSKGKILLVSYQRHYQPSFRYAKEAINKGEIGEIKLISASLAQEWRKFTENTWRQDSELSGGGQLLDSGNHLIDIILWLTGLEPGEVFAFVDREDLKVDIFSNFLVRFKNGALASVAISGDAPGWHENLSIWGTKGALFFQDDKVKRQLSNGDIYQPYRLPYPLNPDINFIRAILGKEEVHSPGSCGLKAIELTSAIYESAKNGKKIIL